MRIQAGDRYDHSLLQKRSTDSGRGLIMGAQIVAQPACRRIESNRPDGAERDPALVSGVYPTYLPGEGAVLLLR